PLTPSLRPYPTLFRSLGGQAIERAQKPLIAAVQDVRAGDRRAVYQLRKQRGERGGDLVQIHGYTHAVEERRAGLHTSTGARQQRDRKSTRLNSSHVKT